jgi:hypothetical protein
MSMETSTLVPEKQYAGRRDAAVVLNMTIDREAANYLRQFVSGERRTMGRFVARLIYEHVARLEERQRMLERVTAAVAEGG